MRKNFVLSNVGKCFNAKFASQYVKCRVREKFGSCTYLIEDLLGKVIGKFHAKI